jgi:FkbM family methyltransferase
MDQPGRVRLTPFLKRILPESVLLRIRMLRYARRMKDGTENYEPEMALVRLLAGSGRCVVDIGASLGWYTRILSHAVGPDGLVCSVEPMPYQFKILDFIRKRLNLDNVNLIHAALSDSSRTVTMVAPDQPNGEPDMYRTHVVSGDDSGSRRSFSVRTMRFDDLQRDLGRTIHFVKCDVEGHELSVLRGAESVLRDSQPSWLLEVWGDPDDPSEPGHSVFKVMAEHGYGTYMFNGHTVRQRGKGERSENGNYFFLKPFHLPAVEAGFPSQREPGRD